MSSQLGEAFIPIRATLDKLDADLAGARKKIEGATGKLSGIGDKIGSFLWKGAIMGAQALAVAIAATAVASVTAAGKFESSMAIMSTAVDPVTVGVETTTEAMGILGDAALAVGGDAELVGVSASSAAEAITGLYKAGLTTGEVFGDLQGYMEGTAELGGALRASVDLAAASELDMVQASELAAVTLATFGGELDTTEERAAFVNDAMNNLVQTADASVASVQGLADALVNVGPTAASLGFSLEDVNVALGILSTRGIEGSEAGTALKSMLVGMMSQTPKTVSALDELGVSLYDVNGVMLPLPEILAQFETGLSGVSEETRNVLIQQIAGSYGMNAMNALLGEGAEGWAKLEAAVGDAATMQDVAAARTDTFEGKMEALKGVMETLLIRAGTPFLGALSKMGDLLMIIAEKQGPAIIARMELYADTLMKAVDAVTLFLTWHDQLAAAATEHAEQVLAESSSYEEYAAEMVRTAVVMGELNEKQGEIVLATMLNEEANQNLSQTMQGLTDKIGLMTDEEYAAMKAAMELNEEGVKLAAAYDATAVSAGAATVATDATTEALGLAAEAAEAATEAQTALDMAILGVTDKMSFEDATADLLSAALETQGEDTASLMQAQIDLMIATQDLTDAEMADLIQKQKQINKLEILGKALEDGIIDWGTYLGIIADGVVTQDELTSAILGSYNAFLDNSLEVAQSDWAEMNEVFGDSATTTGDLLTNAQELANELAGIPGDYVANVVVNVTQNGSAGGTGVPGGATQEFQTGGIVPGNFSEMVPVFAHGSEMILNPEQQARMFSLLDGLIHPDFVIPQAPQMMQPADLTLETDQLKPEELVAPAAANYSATTNVYTQQDPMYVLRAARHLDKLGGLSR